MVLLKRIKIDQQLQNVQKHGKLKSCILNILDLYCKHDILLFFLLANFLLNPISFLRFIHERVAKDFKKKHVHAST